MVNKSQYTLLSWSNRKLPSIPSGVILVKLITNHKIIKFENTLKLTTTKRNIPDCQTFILLRICLQCSSYTRISYQRNFAVAKINLSIFFCDVFSDSDNSYSIHPLFPSLLFSPPAHGISIQCHFCKFVIFNPHQISKTFQ